MKVSVKGIGKVLVLLYLLLFFGGAYYPILAIVGIGCYLIGKFFLREGKKEK